MRIGRRTLRARLRARASPSHARARERPTHAASSSAGTTGASPRHDLGQRAAVGNDAGHAGTQRLRGRIAEAFVVRRNRDDGAALRRARAARARSRTRETRRGPRRRALPRVARIRWRTASAVRPQRCARPASAGERANQHLEILAPLDRADRENRRAVAGAARQRRRNPRQRPDRRR